MGEGTLGKRLHKQKICVAHDSSLKCLLLSQLLLEMGHVGFYDM